MEKYKYTITTGWWCAENKNSDSREKLNGDESIRAKSFFTDWYHAVNKFADPVKILVVDSASPVKPDLPNDSRIEIVSLDLNAGHSTNHIGKFSGVTRAHMMGMVYALSCEVDYWVYIEQDALIYGHEIIEKCISEMNGPVMFGSGIGTCQPVQQSMMIVKSTYIPHFLNELTKIKASDNIISPEMKFAIATSRIASVIPEFLFKEVKKGQRFRGYWMWFLVQIFNKLPFFDKLPIGYGRVRPIDFDTRHFYFQHGSKDELENYFMKLKSDNH